MDFCKQNTNEASKLKKKTWNEFPVKNQLKKRYYKGIYVNFFVCYNFWIAFGGHFGFREKKTCSAPGKLWDFLQVIKDDHLNNSWNFQLYIIFFHLYPWKCLKFLDYRRQILTYKDVPPERVWCAAPVISSAHQITCCTHQINWCAYRYQSIVPHINLFYIYMCIRWFTGWQID